MKKSNSLTAKEISRVIYSQWLKKYDIIIPNCYTQFDNECDLLGIKKSGYLDEIEIKISRSDFLNDAKKEVDLYDSETKKIIREPDPDHPGFKRPVRNKKYEALSKGLMAVNYFWYAVPEGLLKIDDIPDFAGLIEIYYRNPHYFIKQIKNLKNSTLIKRHLNSNTKWLKRCAIGIGS